MTHPPADAPRSFRLAGQIVPAPRLDAGLHVVATPIGNLGDVTIRALETLAGADFIACEDTRVTRRLLDRYGIETPLVAYHDHNAASMRPRLLGRLEQGATVALVSDAGTPLVSDPGYKLVEAAIEAGFRIVPVPGASASLAALVAAGLPTDRFLFDGFLPQRSGARRSRIAELASFPATLVLYESGPRLPESLADLAAGLGERKAAMCRELTKAFEEVRRGSLADLAAHYAEAGPPRGEIVLVIGPPDATEASDADIDSALRQALASLSLKDAAAAVAAATGRPRRDVYARALALQAESHG
ncbi:16S rRNA (cytidine(1402)-2'-O)-methyltransferase [Ancylobacter defluvii]|uniref:Ribosomal RNA small subunit methyltransferase I n=1 Tax=Ancylobacter defluvii TaxID=1282440 RepID=A0A9W6JWE7_9HYPH|nr:16S rRNA (cytidine(1402)-2'-O)-methyltransferase [Ancylobacter defluvii]MBS7587220.1 16S rRNA (cytidine(1402)-2'-O)-methyltransferase [Ancylobacter defluvii]GLK83534.1 ribosomal RNA small subunit methyltransferase I [Ancylobacter defluvii]